VLLVLARGGGENRFPSLMAAVPSREKFPSLFLNFHLLAFPFKPNAHHGEVKSEVRIAVGDLVLVREEDAPEESTRNGAVLT